jgi:hypothetical protein
VALVAALVSAAAGAACGRAQGTAPDAGPEVRYVEPRIVAGAGLSAFMALADGDPVEIIAGPQGGWHLDLGARIEGVPAMGLLRYTLRNDAGVVVSLPAEYAVDPARVMPSGEGWTRVGDRAVLDVRSPDEVSGRPLTLDVRFTTNLGRVLEAHVRIAPWGPA